MLDQNTSKDAENEISEAVLSVYENLITRCPKQISGNIAEILKISLGCLEYDPNYNYDDGDDDEQMEEDNDDEGWGEDYDDEDDILDDDDTSWKVRRAAIKVLDSIFSTSRSELLH